MSALSHSPCGLILAPGVSNVAGFRKLLGMPVVRLTSAPLGPDLASGQSAAQWPSLWQRMQTYLAGGREP